MTAVVDSLMAELVSEALQSVTFTASGVSLQFGDATFTTHVWPTVGIGGSVINLGDRGYRDGLCAFITHEVSGAEETSLRGLVVSFGLGSILTNPAPTDLSGPEVAQLVVYDPMCQTTQLAVWRAGEAPFDGPAWA
jgi:hypothetical protein